MITISKSWDVVGLRASTTMAHALGGSGVPARRVTRTLLLGAQSSTRLVTRIDRLGALPFSTSRRWGLKEYFPPSTDTPNIKITEAAWKHPV